MRFFLGGGAGGVCSCFSAVFTSISLSAMSPCESDSGLDLSSLLGEICILIRLAIDVSEDDSSARCRFLPEPGVG